MAPKASCECTALERLALLWFLQERINRALRVGNDEPLFFWPTLALLRFGLGFLWHSELLSQMYPAVGCESPSRGLNPDARSEHAVANRACLPLPALGA